MRLFSKLLSFFKPLLQHEKRFYIAVAEPMNPDLKLTYKTICMSGLNSLGFYLKDEWYKFDRISINGRMYEFGWEFYVPANGDKIVFFPVAEMKTFSSAYIAKINAENTGGVLLKAVAVTESTNPLVIKRFIDHDQALVIDGDTYNPLPMRWDGFEMSGTMNLPGMKISTFNLGQQVSDYVESIDILENDVVLKLVHIDLLGDVQAKDEMAFQIKMIEGDDLFITFELGINLGLNDLLPRGVITKDEFPGIVDDVIRF